MAKGQEQVAETAALCRDLAEQLRQSAASGPAELAGQLTGVATRLDGIHHRLFLKTGAAIRYSESCLGAAQQVRPLVEVGPSAPELPNRLKALEDTVAVLEKRWLTPGSIVTA